MRRSLLFSLEHTILLKSKTIEKMKIASMALCFLLVMGVLHLVREGWRFAESFRHDRKYESDWKRTLATFASISYIITIIFYGL